MHQTQPPSHPQPSSNPSVQPSAAVQPGSTTVSEAPIMNPRRREFMHHSAWLGVGVGAWGAGVHPQDVHAQGVTAVSGTGQAAALDELVQWNAVELSAAIRTKKVSCEEVMKAYLGRIEVVNPQVNAIVALRDREALLQEAREKDNLLAAGTYQGWMHGMPQAVKDLAMVKGIPSTSGSPLFKNFVPEFDSIFVSRMKKAGAIVIGKTNTPEFGFGSQTYNTVYGTTLNAYDFSKCAGGSSGGAAVALALRLLPVADGSDMMGSLRNPGAFNNVYGFRPSQGRVPFGPTPDLFSQQLGYDGPMGRTVSDMAMLLSTQAGFDSRAPLSLQTDTSLFTRPLAASMKGKKIAWMGDFKGYLPMEEGIMPLCESALQQCQSFGCEVEQAVPKYDMASLWQTWLTLRHFLVAGGLRSFYLDAEKRKLFKPEVIWEIEGGLKLSAVDVFQASVQRSAWYRAITAMFERFDYLALPTAQVFPFDAKLHWPTQVAGQPMQSYHQWMEVVVGPTLSGLPTLNVPVGFSAQGLPMGMSIMGKPQDDWGVLQLGHAYEQATQWVQKVKPKMA